MGTFVFFTYLRFPIGCANRSGKRGKLVVLNTTLSSGICNQNHSNFLSSFTKGAPQLMSHSEIFLPLPLSSVQRAAEIQRNDGRFRHIEVLGCVMDLIGPRDIPFAIMLCAERIMRCKMQMAHVLGKNLLRVD